MTAEEAEKHLVEAIDEAITRVARGVDDDHRCALLIAELQAMRQRVEAQAAGRTKMR